MILFPGVICCRKIIFCFQRCPRHVVEQQPFLSRGCLQNVIAVSIVVCCYDSPGPGEAARISTLANLLGGGCADLPHAVCPSYANFVLLRAAQQDMVTLDYKPLKTSFATLGLYSMSNFTWNAGGKG